MHKSRGGVNWDMSRNSDFVLIKHEAFKWTNFKIKKIKKMPKFHFVEKRADKFWAYYKIQQVIEGVVFGKNWSSVTPFKIEFYILWHYLWLQFESFDNIF